MSNIVTFEQAEKLKYLGFRLNCLHYYNYDGKEELEEAYFFDGEERVFVHDLYEDFNDSNHTCSAPTVSEALDYLREEKGIENGVIPICESFARDNAEGSLSMSTSFIGYDYSFFDKSDDKGEIVNLTTFDTHPLASSALLTAVLDYLEKKGGKNE